MEGAEVKKKSRGRRKAKKDAAGVVAKAEDGASKKRRKRGGRRVKLAKANAGLDARKKKKTNRLGKNAKVVKASPRRLGGIAGVARRVKVVVRRLPDTFAKASQFLEQLEEIKRATKGLEGLGFQVEKFIPGKSGPGLARQPKNASAFLLFQDEDSAVQFCKLLDGQLFTPTTYMAEESGEVEGTESTPEGQLESIEPGFAVVNVGAELKDNREDTLPPIKCSVDLALNRRVVDSSSTEGTLTQSEKLEDDPEFVSFVSMMNHKSEKLPSAEVQLEMKGENTSITENSAKQPVSALLQFLLAQSQKPSKRRKKNSKLVMDGSSPQQPKEVESTKKKSRKPRKNTPNNGADDQSSVTAPDGPTEGSTSGKRQRRGGKKKNQGKSELAPVPEEGAAGAVAHQPGENKKKQTRRRPKKKPVSEKESQQSSGSAVGATKPSTGKPEAGSSRTRRGRGKGGGGKKGNGTTASPQPSPA